MMSVDLDRALTQPIVPILADVERGRLRAYARAIGESDPIYTDLVAARAAGFPDLPVPPTFFFTLELEADDPLGYLTDLDIDLRTVLHGEQSFTYHRPVHAGDVIRCERRISAAIAKTPTMDILTKSTTFLRGDEVVAEGETVIIVRTEEQG